MLSVRLYYPLLSAVNSTFWGLVRHEASGVHKHKHDITITREQRRARTNARRVRCARIKPYFYFIIKVTSFSRLKSAAQRAACLSLPLSCVNSLFSDERYLA